ncbi:MAG: VCBS repeat-containing protein, partial [Myxococcota bacterium]
MWFALMLWSCSAGLQPICRSGSVWDGSEPAFRDATADWGLDQLSLSGVRLSAVDFDGDGWPDLAVRRDDDRMWLLRNTGQGTFEDVTAASGVLTTRNGGDGVRGGTAWIWADVDNDGDLDLFTGLPEPTNEETSELMLNNGDGTFQLGPRGSDLRDRIRMYGAVFTDVDRDGTIDVFLGTFGADQDRLLMGRGDGTFRDRTENRGLTTVSWNNPTSLNEGLAHSNAWAVEACDLTGDGSPDLLSSSYGRAPNHLWVNDGTGRFTNRSVASGYAFDEAADWSDNESARCWCTLHPDAEDCAGVPAPERIACSTDTDAFRWNHATDREASRLGGNSGQTVCADFDQDGHLDLLTSEIVHWDVGTSSDPSQILRNTGDAELTFERLDNESTGLVRAQPNETWDHGDITGDAFDFDNDGRVDVWIGASEYPDNRGLLYHNEGEFKFTAVPPRTGIRHPRSHGSVAADFDRDGDLDLVVGHS